MVDDSADTAIEEQIMSLPPKSFGRLYPESLLVVVAHTRHDQLVHTYRNGETSLGGSRAPVHVMRFNVVSVLWRSFSDLLQEQDHSEERSMYPLLHINRKFLSYGRFLGMIGIEEEDSPTSVHFIVMPDDVDRPRGCRG